jgi:hypothetical protein
VGAASIVPFLALSFVGGAVLAVWSRFTAARAARLASHPPQRIADVTLGRVCAIRGKAKMAGAGVVPSLGGECAFYVETTQVKTGGDIPLEPRHRAFWEPEPLFEPKSMPDPMGGWEEVETKGVGGFYVVDESGPFAFILPSSSSVEFNRDPLLSEEASSGGQVASRSVIYRIEHGDDVYVVGLARKAGDLIRHSAQAGISVNLPIEQKEKLEETNSTQMVLPCFYAGGDDDFQVIVGDYDKMEKGAVEGSSAMLWTGLVLMAGALAGALLHRLGLV